MIPKLAAIAACATVAGCSGTLATAPATPVVVVSTNKISMFGNDVTATDLSQLIAARHIAVVDLHFDAPDNYETIGKAIYAIHRGGATIGKTSGSAAPH